MKRSFVLVIAALIFAAMQFSVLGATIADARPAITGGNVECDTTLQTIPLTHTIGGGTIHWHITGENAKELRALILDRLDNATINYPAKNVLPNDTANGRKIGEIDRSEIWAYVAAGDHSFLQNYLQGLQKLWVNSTTSVLELTPSGENYDSIMFQGVEITRSSLSQGDIRADTAGLLGQTRDSHADIDLYMTISMKDTVKIDKIDLSNPKILAAPFECLTLFDANGDVADAVEYHGDGTMNHWTITIGFDSFYDPAVQKGSLMIIRTPAGELYNYKIDVQEGNAIDENIKHSEFNALENPQILFIGMIFMGYLVVALPTHFYLAYKKAHPKRYRMEAKRIKWLHWTGRIFLIIILLSYFWPMWGSFYISGPIFLGMSVGFVAISGVLSKVTYEKAIESIPPEYFDSRAKKKPVMPSMPVKTQTGLKDLPVSPTVSYDTGTEKIHCIRCGALITIKDGDNLLNVRCPVCGAIQKKVERGYNHLILDSALTNTYTMLSEFLKEGDTALCLTTNHPSKLRRTYHLTGKIKCIWLTAAGGKDTLDPSNLKKISDTVERFADKYPVSIILFDGLEYLIIEHGFDEVMRIVNKINDTASMRDMTLIAPINPSSLSADEITVLKAEFDRVEALEDKDEREFF